jgi:hypothetical protein
MEVGVGRIGAGGDRLLWTDWGWWREDPRGSEAESGTVW